MNDENTLDLLPFKLEDASVERHANAIKKQVLGEPQKITITLDRRVHELEKPLILQIFQQVGGINEDLKDLYFNGKRLEFWAKTSADVLVFIDRLKSDSRKIAMQADERHSKAVNELGELERALKNAI